MTSSNARSDLSRIPPEMKGTVLHRGAWTLCAMDHSAIDPVQMNDPGAPFHHIALSMGDAPVRIGMDGDSRPRIATVGRGDMTVIEAGVGGTSWWNETYRSACFYFTDEALSVALGADVKRDGHRIRSSMTFQSPMVRRLLEALQADAASGQCHGALVGDAVFVAMAAELVVPDREWRGQAAPGTPDWRVRRALEYIHARLTETLSIPEIAAASGTSAFHLNRQFRAAMGLSLWQYVLRERARFARTLIAHGRLSLTQVSAAAGFETYASFIVAMRRTFGILPSSLRAVANTRGP